MINSEDINKAEENINNMLKLMDELVNASPYIIDMKSRLLWYKEASAEIPEESNNFYSMIETPVQSILSLSPTNLDFSSVTGATGSFYSVSADTREVIMTYRSNHYDLFRKYDQLNKTDDLIESIASTIETFRNDLKEYNPKKLILDAKHSFAKWKAGAIDNFELASAIRAFQDVFKGCLRDSWVVAEKLKDPEFSWDKMSNALGKNGGGSKKSLLGVKGVERRLHDEFSEILKKTKSVSEVEMEAYFKEYIEHVYSICNMINLELMK